MFLEDIAYIFDEDFRLKVAVNNRLFIGELVDHRDATFGIVFLDIELYLRHRRTIW